jgi:hypothetical protein
MINCIINREGVDYLIPLNIINNTIAMILVTTLKINLAISVT